MKNCQHEHPDHTDELARLNRLAGQVEGIGNMIRTQRYCPDIITQLRAVQSAAKAIESNILQRHMESCVRDALASQESGVGEEKISELMKLFKRN